MGQEILTFIQLFLGTIIYRPYVYAFFICFLIFSIYHLRLRSTLYYLIIAYLIAFVSEYSSTRNGFPFGMYVYIDDTRVRELWISNIPFWDSLSFVFLSYFSWILAAVLISPRNPRENLLKKSTACLAGLLMMLLDIVIDPLTVLGDRWFLGKMYYYPHGGSYFGVTIANFVGWFFVGTFTPLFFQNLSKRGYIPVTEWRLIPKWFSWGVFGIYSGVFLFNLFITVGIREWNLALASSAVVAGTLIPAGWRLFINDRAYSPLRSYQN